LVADVYGLKTDKAYVNTLEDNIRKRGAMDKLISDCAKAEMSERVKRILRALCISASWHSEPYHENQNFAENRYATVKATTNRVLILSGAPADTWLLVLMYACLLLNHRLSLVKHPISRSSFTSHSMNRSSTIHIPILIPLHRMRNKVGG
jgi:hypothetical protein